MKQILKLIVAILFMAVAVNSYAAKNEDITLIVTSDGATKDEAIKNALRNAIEQTYGVFVSANTDILNDEVVSDEVASVASGNIKSYKELSSSQTDDKTTVTLEAVVSVGKLISYAKSKGAEVEFDGAAMYAEIELQELYASNEELLVENLLRELKSLFKQGYDYELKIDKMQQAFNPALKKGYTPYGQEATKNINETMPLSCTITAKLNNNGSQAWNKLINTLNNIGKKQSNNKMAFGAFPKQGADEFQATLSLLERNNPSYLPAKTTNYLLRSQKSANAIMQFLEELSLLIKNISLDLGDSKIDIRDNLKYYEKDMQPAAASYLMMLRAQNKKTGSVCGEYNGIIELNKTAIKNIKKIKVVANE